MNAKTRVKAKEAAKIAHDLHKLLEELQRELNGEDFAGYLLVTDVKEAVFGRKSSEDVLIKLHAVATMGEKKANG